GGGRGGEGGGVRAAGGARRRGGAGREHAQARGELGGALERDEAARRHHPHRPGAEGLLRGGRELARIDHRLRSNRIFRPLRVNSSSVSSIVRVSDATSFARPPVARQRAGKSTSARIRSTSASTIPA